MLQQVLTLVFVDDFLQLVCSILGAYRSCWYLYLTYGAFTPGTFVTRGPMKTIRKPTTTFFLKSKKVDFLEIQWCYPTAIIGKEKQ